MNSVVENIFFSKFFELACKRPVQALSDYAVNRQMLFNNGVVCGGLLRSQVVKKLKLRNLTLGLNNTFVFLTFFLSYEPVYRAVPVVGKRKHAKSSLDSLGGCTYSSIAKIHSQ